MLLAIKSPVMRLVLIAMLGMHVLRLSTASEWSDIFAPTTAAINDDDPSSRHPFGGSDEDDDKVSPAPSAPKQARPSARRFDAQLRKLNLSYTAFGSNFSSAGAESLIRRNEKIFVYELPGYFNLDRQKHSSHYGTVCCGQVFQCGHVQEKVQPRCYEYEGQQDARFGVSAASGLFAS